jgi:hypothetical protein
MPASDDKPRKACCMISEMLEEAGLDRERTRALRRQLLQGMILLCQWQLERMETHEGQPQPAARRPGPRRARKVAID